VHPYEKDLFVEKLLEQLYGKVRLHIEIKICE